MPTGARERGEPVDDQSVPCSRRSLLRAGVLGGGAAGLLAAGGVGLAGGTAAAAAAPAAALQPLQNLFTLSDLDFDTLFAFGGTGYGSAEFGELVTAVNTINAAGASYQGYYDTFLALAQGTGALADQELAAGHTASARSSPSPMSPVRSPRPPSSPPTTATTWWCPLPGRAPRSTSC